MKIAFVDPFGLPYDGQTLETKGLGGAESSVIYMSRELAKQGHDVVVYNNCDTKECMPGVYEGVTYNPIRLVESGKNFDIVIVLRTVLPFINSMDKHTQSELCRNTDLLNYSSIMNTAKVRILWKHDTYVQGDELIKVLDSIDYVFTLSPWHTKHTIEKLFVQPERIIETRNGYQPYNGSIYAKDPDQFVFNAAAYKGLKVLLQEIWPRVLKHIPTAKLIVIGGYYEGLDDPLYNELKSKYEKEVTFTGVIPPDEVAGILSESAYLIYPCTFPETFGISTLEALAYGVIPIVRKIGALSTTAENPSTYFYDGELTTNKDFDAFTDLVIEAYKNGVYPSLDIKFHMWREVAKEWSLYFSRLINPKKEPKMEKNKRILIAVPTAVRIECETFKSIYDLEIPEGYEVDFNFFWCYMIDQGRNEIANYAIGNGYDYLLAIDSDIEVPKDALKKMLSHDKDLVCGMYRMRRPQEVIELYDTNYHLIPPQVLKSINGLIEIGGCGFGCVLVKTSVLAHVGYPQFFYHQAFRFDQTFSEDNDFCQKARNKGHKLYCDTTIRCRHKGTVMWEIQS
jgi:glycosyltransferase involved in cell wall biosynthesis